MIKYRAGYKYQLVEDYSVHTKVKPAVEVSCRFLRLHQDGTLFIRQDYAWDGPSGPTVDSKDGMRASLVHDALYQLMRADLIDREKWKSVADMEFLRILLEDGMSSIRANLWYEAVANFGDDSTKPRDKDILTAP